MKFDLYHEAPNSIFEQIQKVTEGDYCLAHLYEENKEYKRLFKEAVAKGRKVILDNSIFELGVAFSGKKYAKIVQDLNPTEYIIPDVIDNHVATMESCEKWLKDHKGLPNKTIGVVQGNNYKEIVECYKFMDAHVDKIAFSFNHPFFQDIVLQQLPTKYHYMMKGRQLLLTALVDEKVINVNKPHHALGCGLPQEFWYYKKKSYKWIESIDTSNPVVHGIKGIRYDMGAGLEDKVSQKLCTMIDDKVDEEQLKNIMYNIKMLREDIIGQ